MQRLLLASLAFAAIISLAAATTADAAKKKTTTTSNYDGAILVVDATDGPMPSKKGNCCGVMTSRNGMNLIIMSHGANGPPMRIGR
jgi:uncharacterized protein YijF (DUF1287 family)